MDRKESEPLTTEAAKRHLREAASHVGIGPWVRKQPYAAVATGLLAGFLLGRVPKFWRHLSQSRVGQRMIDRLV